MRFSLRAPRVLAGAVVLLIVAIACAGCGGSSDKSAVCSSRDDLSTSVDALLKTNPIKDGLGSVQTSLADVKTNTTNLAKAAGTQYKPQVDALQTSLQKLSATVKSLGSSPSTSALAALPAQVTAVGTDAKALVDTVGSDCN